MEPDEEEHEEEESPAKTEERSFPAPVAIKRVGEQINLESQLGFWGVGFGDNAGRSYGVLLAALRLGRTILPPDRGSMSRLGLEMLAIVVVRGSPKESEWNRVKRLKLFDPFRRTAVVKGGYRNLAWHHFIGWKL